MVRTDTIDGAGLPLAFLVRPGAPTRLLAGEPVRDVFRVEARTMGNGHQKELLVEEGKGGPVWRLVSDEGPNLKGTDLAPFPLAFFNAGLQADFIAHLRRLAQLRGVPLTVRGLEAVNQYYFSGSFFKGTGQGTAEAAVLTLDPGPDADGAQVQRLMADALTASPAHAALAEPLQNTFALYVNGRRYPVVRVAASPGPDQVDPYLAHRSAPVPAADAGRDPELVVRLPTEAGGGAPQVLGGEGRVPIRIRGTGMFDASGERWVATVHPMSPGARFGFQSALAPAGRAAPSGLALAAAGIAFCYLTQLLRYVEYRHHRIRAIRLVQEVAYSMSHDGSAASRGAVEPVDTHVYVNGDEPDEVVQNLLEVAENTCYLHAALRSRVPTQATLAEANR
jgi:organic hydroperoxide reductase OsmC/OhrA